MINFRASDLIFHLDGKEITGVVATDNKNLIIYEDHDLIRNIEKEYGIEFREGTSVQLVKKGKVQVSCREEPGANHDK